MIVIEHGIVDRKMMPLERRWAAWVMVNCHSIASFDAIYVGPTREYVEAAHDFLQRMAERTAEWWELDNYPCH